MCNYRRSKIDTHIVAHPQIQREKQQTELLRTQVALPLMLEPSATFAKVLLQLLRSEVCVRVLLYS
jgi:hypothetical protein